MEIETASGSSASTKAAGGRGEVSERDGLLRKQGREDSLSSQWKRDEEEDNLDQVLDKIGMGRWQIGIFFINILIWSAMSPHSTGTTLLNAPVPFACASLIENANHSSDCWGNASATEPIFDGQCLSEDGVGPKPQATCPREGVSPPSWKKTELTSCPWVLYDQTVFSSTISTEWDFICEASIKRPLFQNADTFGNIIGCLLAGSIGDYFGRARAILIGSVVHLFSVGIVAFSGSFVAVFFSRIFTGTSNLVVLINAVTHIIETCPTTWRGPIGMLVGLPYSLWTIVFAGMGYFIRHWRHLYMSVTFPTMILLIPMALFLDESPRWLMQKNCKPKAVDVLLKASRRNRAGLDKESIANCLDSMVQDGLPTPKNEPSANSKMVTPQELASETSAEILPVPSGNRGASFPTSPSPTNHEGEVHLQRPSTTSVSKTDPSPTPRNALWVSLVSSSKSLLKRALGDLKFFLGTPYMRRITLVAPITRCLGELVYFGIIFNASNFSSDNPFLYVALTGLFDASAIAVGIPATKYLPRKLTVAGGQMASGFLTLIILCIPKEYKGLQLAVIMTGFLMVAVASQTFYVYLPELFPTLLRARGFAFCSLMGQVGLLIAPFVCDILAVKYWWAVSGTLGASGLIAGSCVLILPETKDLPLCETVEDIEARKLGAPLLGFIERQNAKTEKREDSLHSITVN